jgi:hypothetical protein
MSVIGYAPKLLWTLYDFGVPVKNLSQYIHITTFYNTWPKTRHYPYFIFGDTSFASPASLAGGWRNAITLLVRRNLDEVWQVIRQTLQVSVWLIPINCFLRSRLWTDRLTRRLLIVFGIAVLGYMSFFMLGLGEAKNPRYWLVPITLILAMGVASVFYWFVCHFIPWWRKQHYDRTDRQRAVLSSVATVLILGMVIASYPLPVWPSDSPPPISRVMGLKLEASTSKTERVLLDTNSAMYYWSLYPDRSVVAFPSIYISILPSDAVDELLRVYDVHWVLLSDDGAAKHLVQLGFREVNRAGEETILYR